MSKILLLTILIVFVTATAKVVTSDLIQKGHFRGKNHFIKNFSLNIRKDLENYILSKLKKGKANCAACEILTSIFINYSNVHDVTASDFLYK